MTGAGVVDIKKALEQSDGNEEKAIEILRKKGIEKAAKKSSRQAGEGLIGAYLHTNGKVASLVKVFCETDFVAKNEEFQQLTKDLAMHVVAMNPMAINPEQVSDDFVAKEKEIWKEQLKNEGKPAEMIEKIIEGKEKKLRNDSALMTQNFVKDPEMTVEQLIKEKIAKVGENIQVGEFVRFEL